MRIAVVSPPIDISGGMKQKLLLARALARAGHDVDIVTPDATKFSAFGYQGRAVTPEAARAGPRYDVSIVTWYETCDLAIAIGKRTIHFCQGYEGGLAHLRSRRQAIAAVYQKALPTLVVSPHLAALLSRKFNTRCVAIRPLLDLSFKPALWRLGPRTPPSVLVHGIFEAPVKRVPLALATVAILRRRRSVRLWRISPIRRSEDENAPGLRDKFRIAIPPRDVARLTARADVTLFTSDATEGFGLPVLESLAAGIPAVSTRIPSLATFEQLGTLVWPEADEPAALADCVERLLDPPTWRLYRGRGLDFARMWRRGQDELAIEAFESLLD